MAIYAVERRKERHVPESTVSEASHAEVAADVVNHRKNYSAFTRIFLWSAIVGAAVLGGLLIFIY